MCERTKVEVLARELCIEFYRGASKVSGEKLGRVDQYVEANWQSYKSHATKLLALLETHQ